jgi:hypothetical protein
MAAGLRRPVEGSQLAQGLPPEVPIEAPEPAR